MGRTGVRRWFWLGCGLAGVGAIAAAVLGTGLLGFQLYQLEWRRQGETDLRFANVDLPFTNITDISAQTGSLPFMASVVIDLDNDGRDEVVLGGGRDQADGVFRYDDAAQAFVDISGDHALAKPDGDATLGGASIDVDNDGFTDLLLARESGVWLYRNDNGRLSGERLDLTLDPTTTPLSIALGDINGDGEVDLYISGYLKNEQVEGQTIFTRPYGGYSYLFVKVGPRTWRDATQEYGLRRQHNTFTAVFADADNDGDADLVVAQDTGVVETYQNTGSAPMRSVDNPSVYSYPMGVAAGDFNGDGLIDFYFSNVGHTLPETLTRGDLPEDAPFNPAYMLFENQGDLVFHDTAAERQVERFGFGWGVVAADMDLDGWEDLLVAQNYAKFGQPFLVHRYTGHILRNIEGTHFAPVEKRARATNRLFAIAPLVGDFNGDHLPDLVWANLNGPARAFINTTPDRNWIAVRLPDVAASLNARIEVSVGGRVITRQVVASQGLASDPSSAVVIGLGADTMAENVHVTYPDGRTRTFTDVAAGAVLDASDGRP